jgi:predicted dehydrogenase
VSKARDAMTRLDAVLVTLPTDVHKDYTRAMLELAAAAGQPIKRVKSANPRKRRAS